MKKLPNTTITSMETSVDITSSNLTPILYKTNTWYLFMSKGFVCLHFSTHVGND